MRTITKVEVFATHPNVSPPRAAGLLLACMRREGWTGKPADALVAVALDGVSDDDLTTGRRRAEAVADPWAALRHLAQNPPSDGTLHPEHDQGMAAAPGVLQRLLRLHEPHTAMTGSPGSTVLDLDAPPAPAPAVVPGLLYRRHVSLCSGDFGAAKTLFYTAMMVASIKGTPFLGRPVEPLRWMILDGENPPESIAARWKAYGLTQADQEHVHLTTRERGVKLGEPHWDAWIRQEIEDFRPDVIVIDSVTRCCAVALLDNNAVGDFYGYLVGLIDSTDAACLLNAHHRKSGGRGAEAVMGAGAWTAQTDVSFQLAHTGPLTVTDGRSHRAFVARWPKSGRGSIILEDRPEHYEVRSDIDADGIMSNLTLAHPVAAPSLDAQILAACDVPMGRAALADAVGKNQTGTPFRNALAAVVDDGRLVKGEDGLYQRAETWFSRDPAPVVGGVPAAGRHGANAAISPPHINQEHRR